jgi:LysR family cyn operon transcriptional activator
MQWTLRQLRLFISVADAGSLSAAAQGLGIAQPAASITVRKLERATGTRLLHRRSTGVVLTREGQAFLEHARVIIAQAQRAEQDLKDLRGLERGELVMGVPTMVATHLLPGLLNAFLNRFPGIRVRIVQDGAEEIAERVRRAEFELGFIAESGKHADLASVVIERHPMDACVSASSSLARKQRLGWPEFLAHPLILFPRDFYQRAQIEEVAAKLGIRPDISVETESVPLMLSLVRQGRGIASLPRASAAGVQGVASIPLPAGTDVPIAVCYRRDLVLSRTSQAFLALCKRFKPS